MKNLLLINLTLIVGKCSYADQLEGLAIFDYLIYVILLGAICAVVLFFSVLSRFTRKDYRISLLLNFSATVLAICALIAMSSLGSTIDPGFLVCCLGSIIVCILLITLNYLVGKNSKAVQKEKSTGILSTVDEPVKSEEIEKK